MSVRFRWSESMFVVLAILAFLGAPVAHAKGSPQSIAKIEAVVKQAMPAVVNISSTRKVSTEASPLNDPLLRRFFGGEGGKQFEVPRERLEESLGSGVIVDPSGLIVTNYHVIAKAQTIKVLLSDKRQFDAKVIGADPQTDIAIIKIGADNLPTLKWGNSDNLAVAEPVFAIGNPFGLNETVTSGIVSAVGRANVGIADYEDFIQTDAAINPGNSGGALIDTKGDLMGINTAIFSQSGGYMGIGFAVPSNMAHSVMESLLKYGKVTRGWLGVAIQALTPDLAKQFGLNQAEGALVSQVVSDSPAARAGLRPGDVILGYDGKPVPSPGILRNLVAQTPVNQVAQVKIERGGKSQTINVRIAEQPKQMVAAGRGATPGGDETQESGLNGVQVRALTPDIAQQIGVDPSTRGVVVADVDPNSVVAESGLQAGDVITEIDHKPIRSIEDYHRVVSRLGDKKDVLLLTDRAGVKRFVVVHR